MCPHGSSKILLILCNFIVSLGIFIVISSPCAGDCSKIREVFSLSDLFKSKPRKYKTLELGASMFWSFKIQAGKKNDAILGAAGWLPAFITNLMIIRCLTHEPWAPAFGIAALCSFICYKASSCQECAKVGEGSFLPFQYSVMGGICSCWEGERTGSSRRLQTALLKSCKQLRRALLLWKVWTTSARLTIVK